MRTQIALVCFAFAILSGCHDLESIKPTAAVADAAVSCSSGQVSVHGGCVRVPSCDGLGESCGPSQSESCCATADVDPGMFALGFDNGGAPPTPRGFQSKPQIVSIDAFALDKYEVTVGRFRNFIRTYYTWRSGGQPHPAAGQDPHNPRGGWEASWSASDAGTGVTGSPQSDLQAMQMAINMACNKCNNAPAPGTWTDDAGVNEDKPMVCVSWYEAMLFCIWDNGRLPTEAEWEYAAAGGGQSRAYPWSSPPSSTDITMANAVVTDFGNPNEPSAVGSLVNGIGRWGQYDLAGNAYEWVMDAPVDQLLSMYSVDSNASNPLDLGGEATGGRVLRGGSFNFAKINARTSARALQKATCRYRDVGIRCARDSPYP